MFDGFEDRSIQLPSGIAIRARIGGEGPPILLLHGYPQTSACWHRIAPALVAAGFSVVAPDLRGYGASDKPASSPSHLPYSKRVMAQDQVDLMRHLRSEEHTSELQSLMRISYAVFCLKKKNNIKQHK